MNEQRQKSLNMPFLTVIALALVMIFALLEFSQEGLIILVITAIAAVCGFLLSRSIYYKQHSTNAAGNSSRQTSHPQTALKPKASVAPPIEPPVTPGKTPGGNYLRKLLDELCFLQESSGTGYLYRSLHRVSAITLDEAMGPCSLSLWQCDTRQQNLIRCSLADSNTDNHAQGDDDSLVPMSSGSPGELVPINNPTLRRAIQTGRAFLNRRGPGQNASAAVANHQSQLDFDACIPLVAASAPPMLLTVQLHCPEPRPFRQHRYSLTEGFDVAADIIQLFWRYLQKAGLSVRPEQAGTLISTGSLLPADSFLREAQLLVEKCEANDKPFAAVVFCVNRLYHLAAATIPAAGNFTALFEHKLQKALLLKNEDALPGKLADNTYGIILPHTDRFLGRASMEAVIDMLRKEIEQDQAAAYPYIQALDIRWQVSDQKHYRGNLAALLENIYHQITAGPAQANIPTTRLEMLCNEGIISPAPINHTGRESS